MQMVLSKLNWKILELFLFNITLFKIFLHKLVKLVYKIAYNANMQLLIAQYANLDIN